ncbi:hypothetical protein FGLOB1_9634 [Fusarium globosum]|uniref:Uncharacterized protein n=1 Tax=Fusarium globosum TaxID=78864 RepID=A0A8H5XZL6_9HYPO|nr:hypothetical protein FGLOB1_9634 [Fusarium globosum]
MAFPDLSCVQYAMASLYGSRVDWICRTYSYTQPTTILRRQHRRVSGASIILIMSQSTEATKLAQRALEEHGPLKEVEPNIVSIDGHRFRINYGVRQEVTDRLNELFDRDEVKYEDIPDDLKEYEVKEESNDGNTENFGK